MALIKSYSVGNGDMFCIRHDSDSFTIIDCCLSDDTKDDISNDLERLAHGKGISRFISTHPDDDHIRGLDYLDEQRGIVNFYCVKNGVTKPDDTASFDRYCQLRDSDKACYLTHGCKRKWLNSGDQERGGSGLDVLWPRLDNYHFQNALADAAAGGSPNNTSAVIRYSLNGGASALWMGDLETDFMEAIADAIVLPQTDILFAPHHGRESGKVPESMLAAIAPRVIVIGEAPSEYLHYYDNYNTITQNSAGDIAFDCRAGEVHVFTLFEYDVDFLQHNGWSWPPHHYVGTLSLQ